MESFASTTSQPSDKNKSENKKMIQRQELLALSYYEKAVFTGSLEHMRYRIEKTMRAAENEEEKPEKLLRATIWEGPYAFDHTADEKKTTHEAAFSEDGLCSLVDWMNRQFIHFSNR